MYMQKAKVFYSHNNHVIQEWQLLGYGAQRTHMETWRNTVLLTRSSKNGIPRFRVQIHDLASTALFYGTLLY